MRTPALIAIVAAAAIAVAWLLLARSPQPPAAATPATTAPAPIAPSAAPAAQDEREAAAVRAQTTIPPPEPGPVAVKPSAPPAVDSPQKPAESVATESAADDEPDASNEPSDEAEPTDDDAESSSIDVDRAADLLADWMAKQDMANSDDAENRQVNTKALKTFDQEEADPDWSAQAAQQIEATLNQWLEALPEDVRDHLDLIHVECRQTLCQILAAENEIATSDGQATHAQEWVQALNALEHQTWWNELGFTGLSTAVSHDETSGYFLYQSYLSREVKPPG